MKKKVNTIRKISRNLISENNNKMIFYDIAIKKK